MKRLLILSCLLSLVLLSACSSAFYELAKHRTTQDAALLVSVICIDGSGPPLTGEGKVRAMFVKQGFHGVAILSENCKITIARSLPLKEETEKFRAERHLRALPGM